MSWSKTLQKPRAETYGRPPGRGGGLSALVHAGAAGPAHRAVCVVGVVAGEVLGDEQLLDDVCVERRDGELVRLHKLALRVRHRRRERGSCERRGVSGGARRAGRGGGGGERAWPPPAPPLPAPQALQCERASQRQHAPNTTTCAQPGRREAEAAAVRLCGCRRDCGTAQQPSARDWLASILANGRLRTGVARARAPARIERQVLLSVRPCCAACWPAADGRALPAEGAGARRRPAGW